ncbi:NAD-dependent epimerase/dehydratase family protein [Burkholderia latens]|uniref:NAD-dependent epimerase/dehydratase family protein n=1 Tax=Burkholderia latens TaxID=488446 RepID=UPI001C977D73|nr:NAD-dependent epimerase/dehydratase family protein [Burkholderia latens]MBY4694060.1 NAD-dependent epimerase/dehydratase family protein [Burkholderia latens]
MTHVVVTGANGFVGRALCRVLADSGLRIGALVRHPRTGPAVGAEWVHAAPDFVGVDRCWPAEYGDVDCVVHLAARVHVMSEADNETAQLTFDATNVDGALRVARAAYRHGVRRFVYVSSIKAIAGTGASSPLREDAPARPDDAYGRSKLRAEHELSRLRDELGLDVVIVRPPLVYGPGVGANFLQMMRAVSRGVPLPLARVGAKRSLLFVDNLADALMRCALDARAENGCFHVADDDVPTVAELLTRIGAHIGRPARVFPMPVPLLKAGGRLTGRAAQIERLTGSLVLDTSAIRSRLGWRPPHSLDDGLAATVAWFESIRDNGG